MHCHLIPALSAVLTIRTIRVRYAIRLRLFGAIHGRKPRAVPSETRMELATSLEFSRDFS
jgi:hypothetical protein